MQNFYDLTTADLQRAVVTQDALGRIITRYSQQAAQQGGQGMASNDYEITALLASIARNAVPANCRYNVYSASFDIQNNEPGFGYMQQMLPQNLARKYLAVEFQSPINAPATADYGNYSVLFEETNINGTDIFDPQTSNLLARSLRLIKGTLLVPGVMVFTPPPTNAVSIIVNVPRGDGFTSGRVVVIEGV